MGTRKITPTGTIPILNPSSSKAFAAQLQDILTGLQSQISQVVTEYNDQVWPLISSLPHGREETRWVFRTDNIYPLRNGLDGDNVLVDTDATNTSDGGRYWSTANRPKTIREALNDLYSYVSDSVDAVRSEVSVTSGTGISPASVLRIGANIFDLTQTSSASSLDGLTSSNQSNILQLAKDLYDDTLDSLDKDGNPNLTYSIYDHLVAILAIHGGSFDTDLTLTHDGVGGSIGATYRNWTAATGASTTSTSEIVVGGTVFDPSEFGDSIGSLVLYFEGLLNYDAAGAAGGGECRLYDMGAPGATTAGTLVSTLSFDYLAGGIMDRERNQLTVVSSSPTTDEILNEERVYEIRILTDGAGDPADAIIAEWAGFSVEPI